MNLFSMGFAHIENTVSTHQGGCRAPLVGAKWSGPISSRSEKWAVGGIGARALFFAPFFSRREKRKEGERTPRPRRAAAVVDENR